MNPDQPIYVTRPWLPPLAEFLPHLTEIWNSRILTNRGPYHERFESALCRYLGVRHVSLFANATLGLISALRVLRLRGEVVTTPFSFVASPNALVWAGLVPVFADIDPHTLNLAPDKLEAAISANTSAILPVHCYGRACEIEAIDAIAAARGLKVVYDAAAGFGVQHRGRSLLDHGDMSVVSFHATKVFNTFEGGAVVVRDEEHKLSLDRLADFGIVDEDTVTEAGLNAKLSEFGAALGLLQLESIDAGIARRRELDATYRALLAGVPGLRCLGGGEGSAGNGTYFPVLVEPEYGLSRDALVGRLREHGFHARKYYAPLLSTLPMYRDLPSADPANLPVATRAAASVLCLPLYPDLEPDEQLAIVELIRRPSGRARSGG